MSKPQIIVEVIINRLPESHLNMEVSSLKSVDTMNNPTKTNTSEIYPNGRNRSLNITRANKIEKTVSPFANRAVLEAVVCFSPRKKILGATAAPAIALIKTSIKYFFERMNFTLA